MANEKKEVKSAGRQIIELIMVAIAITDQKDQEVSLKNIEDGLNLDFDKLKLLESEVGKSAVELSNLQELEKQLIDKLKSLESENGKNSVELSNLQESEKQLTDKLRLLESEIGEAAVELYDLRELKSQVTGKWVLENDPAILNAHQVREQAVVLVPVTEEVAADEE